MREPPLGKARASRPFAIGLVIYKPPEVVVERIVAAHEQGFRVFVFDNSPEDGVVREALADLAGTRYRTMGHNAGLGCGLSSVCASAYYEGYGSLLFFDQDTVFTDGTLEFVSGFLGHCGHSTRTAYSAVSFKSVGPKRGHPDAEFQLRPVRLIISSGSLFFLERLQEMKWHNLNYFVDCVDYEFCLRSARHGLKVAVCYGAPGFDHRSEQADTEVVILGRSIYLRRYPWARVTDTASATLRLMGTALISRRLGYLGELTKFLFSYALRQVVARLLLRGNPRGA